ncbi:hypothetical protein J1605_003346 [Eschrichtius robustus]|uniref:Uncharacterized protein n=1 Tax=Eschrichtius robustus TaxID=9764 RepID=A0AB34HST2_ESCRO|nr:hypothetical protein J1605_003346 [Eschrichtius robustus]
MEAPFGHQMLISRRGSPTGTLLATDTNDLPRDLSQGAGNSSASCSLVSNLDTCYLSFVRAGTVSGLLTSVSPEPSIVTGRQQVFNKRLLD